MLFFNLGCFFFLFENLFCINSSCSVLTKVIRLIFPRSRNLVGAQVSLTDVDTFEIEGRTCWFCFRGVEVQRRPNQNGAIEMQENHHLTANSNLLIQLAAT